MIAPWKWKVATLVLALSLFALGVHTAIAARDGIPNLRLG